MIFLEPRLPLEFLISELPGYMSRDTITIAAGSGIVVPGTVLAKTGIAGTVASAVKASGSNTANSGALTPDAVAPVLPFATSGIYQVRCIAAAAGGTFRVSDPKGSVLGDVATGSTFANRIKFAIAAGATAFAVGDGFDILVEITGGTKFVPALASAPDGSDMAAAINMQRVDATLVDVQVAAITNGAEVVGAMLTYDTSVNTPALVAAKNGQLAGVTIKVR